MNDTAQNGSHRWLVLGAVIIGTFMSILDTSIVNIAIPKMMAVFNVPLEDVKWVLTSYTMALGAVIPLTGVLADTYGSKRVYLFALIVFTLGSLLCSFAWSNTSMVVFRVIQAIGGGMIMPVGMSIVLKVFPPHERGMAMGFWGIAAMAAPSIGPTLGGYFIEKMDWRLIFNLNVPIGVCGTVFTMIVLRETPRKPLEQIDYIGFLSSTIGLVSILYVLGEGASIDWNEIKNPLLCTLGVGSLLIFVVNELTHPNPLLDLRIFKIFDFSVSQSISCITTLGMMGGMYVLPLFLQNVRGYTAMQTGLILLPAAISAGLMMPISGALFDRFGAKMVMTLGLTILAISTYRLSFLTLDTARSTVVWLAMWRGVGLGLSMTPANTAGMNAIPSHLYNKATAISNTVRQVTSSVSVTIVTTLIQNKFNESYLRMAEQVNLFNPWNWNIIEQLQKMFLQTGQTVQSSQGSALSVISDLLLRQANVDAMNYAIVVLSAIIPPVILLVWMMRETQRAHR